jgi:hypothetical protein
MLLLSPAYHYAYRQLVGAQGVPFSHAYHGAIRHAITVGFVSLMIMGFAAKVVPTLNGLDPRALSALRGPFLLVNVGCLLRVLLQTLTDWFSGIYPLLGLSGTLEVIGLAWWGLGSVQIMRRGKCEANALEPTLGPQPKQIEGHHRVAQILAWFPQTESVFLDWGFVAIRQPLLRRTVARQVTLSQAAAIRGVPLNKLLAALNLAITPQDRASHASLSGLPIIQIGVKP